MSTYLIIRLTPEAIGLKDPLVSTFARAEGMERKIFNISELLFLVEILFHLLDWQELKRNILIFNCWAIAIALFVLPFYPTHPLATYWVLLRSARKNGRIMHHVYLNHWKESSKKTNLCRFERLCIDFLTFSFPIEYLLSVVIVLVNYELIQHSAWLRMPLPKGYSLNLAPLYLVSVATTMPMFVVSLVQVWRKREKLVYEKVVKKK